MYGEVVRPVRTYIWKIPGEGYVPEQVIVTSATSAHEAYTKVYMMPSFRVFPNQEHNTVNWWVANNPPYILEHEPWINYPPRDRLQHFVLIYEKTYTRKDLIRIFCCFLSHYALDKLKRVRERHALNDDYELPEYQCEVASIERQEKYIIQELAEAIDELSPDGYYFGQHPTRPHYWAFLPHQM